jgi:allantoinase
MPVNQSYLVIKAQNAILSPQHQKAPAEVLVDQSTGKIVEIATDNKKLTTVVNDTEVIELAEDQLLMAGLVDAHGK